MFLATTPPYLDWFRNRLLLTGIQHHGLLPGFASPSASLIVCQVENHSWFFVHKQAHHGCICHGLLYCLMVILRYKQGKEHFFNPFKIFMEMLLSRRKKRSKVKVEFNFIIWVHYFFPSIHSIYMANFLHFCEGKISMVSVHEIEGIVEFLNRCIVVKRVGNRMMWEDMLFLIGCHCQEG